MFCPGTNHRASPQGNSGRGPLGLVPHPLPPPPKVYPLLHLLLTARGWDSIPCKDGEMTYAWLPSKGSKQQQPNSYFFFFFRYICYFVDCKDHSYLWAGDDFLKDSTFSCREN